MGDDADAAARLRTGFAELLEQRDATLTPEQRREWTRHVVEGARELQAILDAAPSADG